ncbi:DNA repair protein RecO [Aequorivita echinoideorum]|uniref:DNA repair protein RecO n=1 Tax=Aequorivita echinoideorum TaxID=1549647 RepID=A0ABS5S1E3_9FLAO|nr:DNA repair protein RecO [Aequorivita echinoideorum]MBT0607010.1 DNA repair protein RecO [Aequorivita echinoideorum]
MVVTTKAIVFSAIKYAEADLIVSCFTETSGIKNYLLRGILKSKKGKLKTSFFQPLTQLEIVAEHKNKGTLEYIKEAKIHFPYQTLHTDIVKSGLVMFLSEILKNCIKEEEPNPELYSFMEKSFIWMDSVDEVANFHIHFLLELSAYLGFYPDSSNLQYQFFNILEGNFQEKDTGNYCVEGENVEYLKLFFNKKTEEISEIKMSKANRSKVLDLMLTYYRFHVQGYQAPKSLAVLNALYS